MQPRKIFTDSEIPASLEWIVKFLTLFNELKLYSYVKFKQGRLFSCEVLSDVSIGKINPRII